jgi:hypothetical protein
MTSWSISAPQQVRQLVFKSRNTRTFSVEAFVPEHFPALAV